MNSMRERLIEQLDTFCQKELGTNFNKDILDKFADYLLADGWIRLPCNVGDTLYDITEFLDGTSCPEIYEIQDVEMMIEKNKDGKYIFSYDSCYICGDKIGTSLFLTREEAEKALKRKEDKSNDI